MFRFLKFLLEMGAAAMKAIAKVAYATAKIFVGIPCAIGYTVLAGAFALSISVIAAAGGYIKRTKGTKQLKPDPSIQAISDMAMDSVKMLWGWSTSPVTDSISYVAINLTNETRESFIDTNEKSAAKNNKIAEEASKAEKGAKKPAIKTLNNAPKKILSGVKSNKVLGSGTSSDASKKPEDLPRSTEAKLSKDKAGKSKSPLSNPKGGKLKEGKGKGNTPVSAA